MLTVALTPCGDHVLSALERLSVKFLFNEGNGRHNDATNRELDQTRALGVAVTGGCVHAECGQCCGGIALTGRYFDCGQY